jgi:hypothetical protein
MKTRSDIGMHWLQSTAHVQQYCNTATLNIHNDRFRSCKSTYSNKVSQFKYDATIIVEWKAFVITETTSKESTKLWTLLKKLLQLMIDSN